MTIATHSVMATEIIHFTSPNGDYAGTVKFDHSEKIKPKKKHSQQQKFDQNGSRTKKYQVYAAMNIDQLQMILARLSWDKNGKLSHYIEKNHFKDLYGSENVDFANNKFSADVIKKHYNLPEYQHAIHEARLSSHIHNSIIKQQPQHSNINADISEFAKEFNSDGKTIVKAMQICTLMKDLSHLYDNAIYDCIAGDNAFQASSTPQWPLISKSYVSTSGRVLVYSASNTPSHSSGRPMAGLSNKSRLKLAAFMQELSRCDTVSEYEHLINQYTQPKPRDHSSARNARIANHLFACIKTPSRLVYLSTYASYRFKDEVKSGYREFVDQAIFKSFTKPVLSGVYEIEHSTAQRVKLKKQLKKQLQRDIQSHQHTHVQQQHSNTVTDHSLYENHVQLLDKTCQLI